MSRALVWFRNDLRTVDHPGLSACADAEILLPVYIYPPRLFGRTSFGFAKTGPFRAAFLIETVQALQRSLRDLGSDLVVCQGDPAALIPALMTRYGLTDLWFQEEPGTEEGEEQRAVESALGRLVHGGRDGANAAAPAIHRFPTRTLFHPQDIPFAEDRIPDVYSDFRRGVERSAKVRMPLPAPGSLPRPPAPIQQVLENLERDESLLNGGFHMAQPTVEELAGKSPPEPDPRGVLRFTGGERSALQRLQRYFWESDSLSRYKLTRNGLLGADYSSKLSPWLANGSLSPRSVYREVRRYERERVKNDSTYWLIFELIWRDYFSFLARKYPRTIFSVLGPMQRRLPWSRDRTSFERWLNGRTGQDFIDANMREIAATGYMSNRGRQNVASFLARNLNVSWLMGAQYFESILIDYDPASNYGNWSYTAGVGTDPRRERTFNPERQARTYDADGSYRRHWLGRELREEAGDG